MNINHISKEKLTSRLTNLFGEKNILIDPESKLIYGKDLTNNFTPDPMAIVFPENQEQVVELVKIANETKTALVPSGGRTGYSAGAVAANQEIVVSFEKMNKIISFDACDRSIKCEPGVTLKEIQNFASQNNLFYPIDFAPSDTCQIGGMVATNAGGIKVIRYGLTRNWISGLKVVTGNADCLELNYGLIKNACGYDFRHLFIGSEGTLGFITEVTVKLAPKPVDTKVVLLSVNNCRDFLTILNLFQKKLIVSAFEFFSDSALSYMLSESKLNHLFSQKTEFYILVEYESSCENDIESKNIIQNCINHNFVNNFLVSENKIQAKQFWRYRVEISRALNYYFPYKYDIAVLSSKIADFITQADLLLLRIYSGFKIIWFGHAGDGNLHLNILKPNELDKSQFYSYCATASNELYALIKQFRGAISAEHGVGLLKKEFLKYSKSETEINYMREIKKIFDRNNIMNPGKMI